MFAWCSFKHIALGWDKALITFLSNTAVQHCFDTSNNKCIALINFNSLSQLLIRVSCDNKDFTHLSCTAAIETNFAAYAHTYMYTTTNYLWRHLCVWHEL